ncbi:hypothetical protein U757_08305 [Streptococcus mitis 21/39]|uniref:Uncharacterized protein n=1 Tax=Streptococcus mitis 21/39 TaxID=1415765 RepID=V8I4I9_STRMT|nr:hypothetical protein U757_08305 [Streptococcus mitis 21/39]
MPSTFLLLIFSYYTLFSEKRKKGYIFFKNIIQFGMKHRLF